MECLRISGNCSAWRRRCFRVSPFRRHSFGALVIIRSARDRLRRSAASHAEMPCRPRGSLRPLRFARALVFDCAASLRSKASSAHLPIVRLPSGSPASRSTSFRSGVFGVGVGTAHGCTWRVGGTSAHPRSASDPSFGVRSRIHPHMRAHGPVRNTFTRGPAPASAASARSRLSRDLRPRG